MLPRASQGSSSWWCQKEAACQKGSLVAVPVESLQLVGSAMGKLRDTLAAQRRKKKGASERKSQGTRKSVVAGTGTGKKRASSRAKSAASCEPSSKPTCKPRRAAARLNPPTMSHQGLFLAQDPLATVDTSSPESRPFNLPSILSKARGLLDRRPVPGTTELRSPCTSSLAAAISCSHEPSKSPAHLPSLQSSQVTISKHDAGSLEDAEEDIPLSSLLHTLSSVPSSERSPVSSRAPLREPCVLKATELSPISLYLSGSPLTGFERCLEISPLKQPGLQLPRVSGQEACHTRSPFPTGVAHQKWELPWPGPFTNFGSPGGVAFSGAQVPTAGKRKGSQLDSDGILLPPEQPSQEGLHLPPDLHWLTLPECKPRFHL